MKAIVCLAASLLLFAASAMANSQYGAWTVFYPVSGTTPDWRCVDQQSKLNVWHQIGSDGSLQYYFGLDAVQLQYGAGATIQCTSSYGLIDIDYYNQGPDSITEYRTNARGVDITFPQWTRDKTYYNQQTGGIFVKQLNAFIAVRPISPFEASLASSKLKTEKSPKPAKIDKLLPSSGAPPQGAKPPH